MHMSEGSHPSLDIRVFARSTFDRSVSMWHLATDEISDEDLYWRPNDQTNSIAWLGWHLARRKDYYSARLVGDTEVWASDGWYERFGLTPVETGLGHTIEEVAAFRPGRDLLTSYYEQGANAAGVARLERVDPSSLDVEVELDAGRGMKPRSQIWNPMISDCLQHLGQIAYLRGLITGRGWFAV
jgi:hypothetical protein